MSDITIDQMNEVIARFMGMEGTFEFIRQNYSYHTNWDLLMPVVEKIEEMGYKFQICRRRVTIEVDGSYTHVLTLKEKTSC